MGSFAEINLRLKLKMETPNEIIVVLKYLSGQIEEIEELPNHPFFSMNRWRSVCLSHNDSTAIQGKFTHFKLNTGQWELCFRSVYKDRGEAKEFLTWLLPYLDEDWLAFLGYIKYDSSEHPTLIYYKEKNISFIYVGCEETEVSDSISYDWKISEL